LKPNQTLLGLYEGVPQTRRGSNYGMVLPDKITIFQQTIEAICRKRPGKFWPKLKKSLGMRLAHHFRHQRCQIEGNRQILIDRQTQSVMIYC